MINDATVYARELYVNACDMHESSEAVIAAAKHWCTCHLHRAKRALFGPWSCATET
jgi:hypothetical protein